MSPPWVVLRRLRDKLSLRDLAEMFLIRGIVFSYEAVRDWETKLTAAGAASIVLSIRRARWTDLRRPEEQTVLVGVSPD